MSAAKPEAAKPEVKPEAPEPEKASVSVPGTDGRKSVRDEVLGLREEERIEKVVTKGKGGREKVFWVRTFSAEARGRIEEGMRTQRGRGATGVDVTLFKARVLAASICDEAGKLQFTDRDVGLLAGLPDVALTPLYDRAA